MKPHRVPLQHQKPRGTSARTSSEAILGVDPGGKTTGFVVRAGASVISAELVTNTGPDYLPEILAALRALYGLHCRLVAVEGLNHPSPHLGIANLDGLLETAQVLGAIRAACVIDSIPCVVVPPGGHGSGPLKTYPAAIVGATERRGTGKLRHCRSAYDVAGASRSLLPETEPVKVKTH